MSNLSETNLQEKKLNLQIQLKELQNKNASIDDVNELKAEIVYINKQLSKLLGTKELKRREELEKRKSGIEQKNIKQYNSFKNKYKKISPMTLAYTKMISAIESMYLENTDNIVKVKR